ncbi:hypothetical protein [Streptodolium elevatio]
MSTTAGRRSRPCVVPVVRYSGDITQPTDPGGPDEPATPAAPVPSPLCRGARIRRR